MFVSKAFPRKLVAAAIGCAFLASCGGSSVPQNTGANQSFSAGNKTQQRHYGPPPHPPARTHIVTPADRALAKAGGWQEIAAPAPFGANGAGTPLLMTDGTVMIQDNTSNWYKLTPDSSGNYVNGTWSQMASLPSGYGPLYFASAIRPDGKLIINGGEYNFGRQDETNLGALYDPVANTWTSVTAPSGWSEIGDASSVILPDGTYMLGNCCYSTQALMSPGSSSWTIVGTGKNDTNSEEGWTLLPNGKIVTADVFKAPASELYTPGTQTWASAGNLPANLEQSFEMGPQVLRYNHTVFVAGANQYTAIYHLGTGTWTAGPNFPVINGQQVDIADGPAALLTNGNEMMVASAGVYSAPAYVLMLTASDKLGRVPGPPNFPNDSSYNVRLLLLPTGQILETDSSDDVEIYTPANMTPVAGLAPVVSSVPSMLTHGQTYKISGQRFNGFSQANAYGDDAQSATNYPLVQITVTSTGHAFYARTHDFSFMGIASNKTVSANFDVPSGIDTGAATLVVITNGVASPPVSVTIQ